MVYLLKVVGDPWIYFRDILEVVGDPGIYFRVVLEVVLVKSNSR